MHSSAGWDQHHCPMNLRTVRHTRQTSISTGHTPPSPTHVVASCTGGTQVTLHARCVSGAQQGAIPGLVLDLKKLLDLKKTLI